MGVVFISPRGVRTFWEIVSRQGMVRFTRLPYMAKSAYPIVQVRTSDNLWLYGLLLEATDSKTIFLHTHGTASNFYEEYFVEVFSKKFVTNGVSLLSANNRGAYVYDAYQKSGAVVEQFEDCLIDFDAWIEFILEKGYKNIILSGHSLGTEKAVYYLNKGKHKDKIKALVLLAPADSFGYHLFDGGQPSRIDKKRVETLLEQARELVAGGEGDTFLPRDAYGGIMPKTAASFVNFLETGSELSIALPFRERIL